MKKQVVGGSLAAIFVLSRTVLAFSFLTVPVSGGSGPSPSSSSSSSVQRESRSKMVPWMGQSFNSKAVATLGRVLWQPSLAVPHLSLPHIGDLDFAALRALGCRGVVFDKDNTLTAPYLDVVHPLVKDGLVSCVKEFGDRVCIMSNSAGTRDDPGHVDADRIEAALGIQVIRHEEKKPGGIEDVLDFFSDREGSKVKAEELCIVGDRLLTDVVFGNLHGMFTVHTSPLTLEGDNKPAIVSRYIERKVFMSLLHRRFAVAPIDHPLCPEGASVLLREGGLASK